MGQAKQRGTFEERKALAIARREAELAEFIRTRRAPVKRARLVTTMAAVLLAVPYSPSSSQHAQR